MKRAIVLFFLATSLPSSTVWAVQIATGITTDAGWSSALDGSADNTGAHVLTSIADANGTYTGPTFADSFFGDPGTANGLAGTSLFPGYLAAQTDNRVDTGALNVGVPDAYTWGSATLGSTDQVFVIFNAGGGQFFETPGTVEATDSTGTVLAGSSVVDLSALGMMESDALGRMDLFRFDAGATMLNNRSMYGFTIAATDFLSGTLTDVSTIKGVRFGGSASNDFHMVGFASPGVVATAAEWDVTGGGSWGTGSNWDINDVPVGLDTTFGSAITGNATITLGEDRSVGNLIFDNNNSYTLSGNTLFVSGDVSTISGSHTISSTLQLSGGTRTLTSSAGASLSISGTTQTGGDAAATIILDGAGGGSLGAIRDNNDVGNPLDGTDNINIVKRGTGTWTIGSGSTTLEDFHGGSTTIEAGTLKVNGGAGSTGELRSPTISVQAGATLDTSDFGTYSLAVGQSLNGGGTIDAGGSNTVQIFSDNNVTLGDGGTGTLSVTGNLALNGVEGSSPSGGLVFELSDSSAGANDQIAVSGNVTSNAGTGQTAISIIPTGGSLDTSYELITFGGTHTGAASDYQLDTSLETRFTQSISINANSVNLDITGSNASLIWNGNVSENWDVNSTANWQGGQVFFDLDNVTFNDTASGSGTVNVATTVSPASTTVDNTSKDYTLTGSGQIAGAGGVTKSGSGRLTVANSNTYTGTTNITGGVLHAAGSGALGSTDGGTVVNGGTLDITSNDITGETVSIQGAGSDGRGALITDGLDALGGGTQQISDVIQTGNATIGAYAPDQAPGAVFASNDYRWDLEPGGAAATASWQGNGHDLTKKGRGTVSIQGTGDMNVANVNIEQGIMFWQGSTTASGATVTIGNGSDPYTLVETEPGEFEELTGVASLNTFYSGGTAGAPPTAHAIDVVMQGGSFGHQSSNGTAIAVSGTFSQVDVTGNDEIDNAISASNTATLTIDNPITGNGDLLFQGEGTVVLQGNSTYTGRTEVSANLQLTGSGGLSSTPRIEMDGTGSIDASGRTDGTFALAGQTLSIGNEAATAAMGEVTAQITPTQDTVIRYNPANPDADSPDADGMNQLFAGTVSGSDLTRSIMEFDLTSVPSLTGVTDISGVTMTLQNNNDGGSVGASVNVEIHELTQPFVDTQADASQASDGVPWTGYTGAANDPNAAGAGALGSLVSVVASAPGPGTAGPVEFPDNQGGTPFETLIESTLAGSGSVNLLVKVDDTAEATNQRNLFRFSETGGGGAPTLNITFNGTIVDTVNASIVGDFDMDSSSTLEFDVFNDTFTDFLDISGAADLNGILDVSLVSGSTLVMNDTVTVLTAAGGITDSGLSVSGPFSHSIVGNDLVLTFLGISGLAGDFNADGVVDAADYTVWRDNLGAADETALNGNGNGADGVDSADYALWKANFGNTSGAGAGSRASVPEPTSITLLLLSLAAVCGAARRS